MIKQITGIVILSIFFAGTAFAVGEGAYLGLMAGYASSNASNQQATVTLIPGTPIPPSGCTASGTSQNCVVTVKPKSNQAAIRAYLGYQFNDWGGVELGGTYYTVVNFRVPANVQTTATPQAGIATVDLVGVLSVPLWYFNVFAKAGPAIVYQGTSRTIRPAPPPKNKYQTSVYPTFSLGAGYSINPSWVVDVSWTRVMTSKILKSFDFYALGFSYHFVSLYCGQFLCD